MIGSSRAVDGLGQAVSGDEFGTWVEPRRERMPARKLWIAFGQPAEGVVSIDEGARTALLANGRSLLAVGVKQIRGTFEPGSAVEIHTLDSRLVGKGIVRMSSNELERSISGRPDPSPVVVHRDDLVVLSH